MEYNETLPIMKRGWNFIGNPYPSAINLASLDFSKIGNAVYIYDPSIKNYKIYQKDGITINGKQQYIGQCQGFVVNTTSPQILTLNYKNRIHATPETEANTSVSEMIRLSVEKDGIKDETVIAVIASATDNFDSQYDALKFESLDVSAINMATDLNGSEQKYAINAITDPGTNERIFNLQFKAPANGNYQITASEVTINAAIPVKLIDKKLNNTYDLRVTPTINFDYSISDTENRFQLVLNPKNTSVADIENQLRNTKIFSVKKAVIINLLQEQATTVEVYTVSGAIIYSTIISDKGDNRINLDAATGNYLVKLSSKNGSLSKLLHISE